MKNIVLAALMGLFASSSASAFVANQYSCRGRAVDGKAAFYLIDMNKRTIDLYRYYSNKTTFIRNIINNISFTSGYKDSRGYTTRVKPPGATKPTVLILTNSKNESVFEIEDSTFAYELIGSTFYQGLSDAWMPCIEGFDLPPAHLTKRSGSGE